VKKSPEPFTSPSLIPPRYHVRDAARVRLVSTLRKILNEPGAQQAFNLLVEKGCDRAFLECWLTEPVEADSPSEDADARKAARHEVRALVGSLIKARKLAGSFHRQTGESTGYLVAAIDAAIAQASPWLLPRPVLLFSRRQNQQFRLLEHLRRSTGRWRLSEAVALLSAVYTINKVPGEHPTEEALAYLAKRFRLNQAQHRRGRPKTR
jgi:hypothetical protein